MQGNIWLIGGTSDSAAIAKELAAQDIAFVITVATDTALSLYADESEVVVGCLSISAMHSFCQQYQIIAVVDASHPFAVEVSRQVIAITNQLDIPYLRYERQEYQSGSENKSDSSIIELDSFKTLLANNYLQNQRVLLTVGCKALPLFKPWHDRAILFARILPKITSLKTALESGFTRDRLIAIRPPISINLERALWQQWNISTVVTKASGKAGGENLKRQLAKDLDIPLIVVTRPPINYPQQTSSLSIIVAFCFACIK